MNATMEDVLYFPRRPHCRGCEAQMRGIARRDACSADCRMRSAEGRVQSAGYKVQIARRKAQDVHGQNTYPIHTEHVAWSQSLNYAHITTSYGHKTCCYKTNAATMASPVTT